MADGDIDLYGDVTEDFDVNNSTTEGDDLYNDIITGNSADSEENSESKPETTTGGASSTTNEQSDQQTPRNFFMHGPVPANRSRHGVYVGNMTWWTTDDQLQDAINTVGVADILEIKFFENRSNGQSKGLATVLLKSDESVKILLKKLPQKELNGQTLICTVANKQNLSKFDLSDNRSHVANGKDTKNTPKVTGMKKDQPSLGIPRPPITGSVPAPTSGPNVVDVVRLLAIATNASLRPGLPPPMGFPPRLTGPPLHAAPGMRGPPPSTRMEWNQGNAAAAAAAAAANASRPTRPVGVGGGLQATAPGNPTNQMTPGAPTAPGMATAPAPHVNPAFFPTVSQAPSAAPQADPFGRPAQYPGNPADPYGTGDRNPTAAFDAFGRPIDSSRGDQQPISEAEFEELFSRNKTVSSSAINKSVQDARAGDYASAIETLVTAISLIKQSKIANDDRCKILISSLQDTLHGIESKSYGGKSSRRDRSRSRERDERKRSRRDRSRSRERDYRDRSRERYYDDHYESRHHRSSRR